MLHIRHLLRHRGKLAATVTAAVLPVSLAWAGMATAGTTPQPFQLPPIKHVWVIELENEGLSQSFGDPSADPYLAKILRSRGRAAQELLRRRPRQPRQLHRPDQRAGAGPRHAERLRGVDPVQAGRRDRDAVHQLVGNGCVYPASVLTLGNQLSAAHLTWKAYLQDMGNEPGPRPHHADQAGPGLRPPEGGQARRHRGRHRRRPVRGPARGLHVLRVGDRQPGLLRRAHPVVPAAAEGPVQGAQHAELLVALAEPVHRRPRRARAPTASPAA